MALTYSEPVKLGMAAPDFRLLGTDELEHGLTDFRYAKALVIAFICNHCPYVKAIQGRLNALAREYRDRGVQVVGINSNDWTKYPDDSFEAMKARAAEQGYVFPYLWDKTQAVAKAYGAVCTPDFYLFAPVRREEYREPDVTTDPEYLEGSFILKYRGRMDDHWQDETKVTRRDLARAIDEILAGREPDGDQKPSMGCSIKWK